MKTTQTTNSQGGTVTRNNHFPTSTLAAPAPKKKAGKIESGIEIPERRGRKTQYPFAAMQVGDSFWWPTGAKSGSGRLMTAAQKFCRNHDKPWKFTARAENDGDIKGARIWRVK